jgi:hypothetical protein
MGQYIMLSTARPPGVTVPKPIRLQTIGLRSVLARLQFASAAISKSLRNAPHERGSRRAMISGNETSPQPPARTKQTSSMAASHGAAAVGSGRIDNERRHRIDFGASDKFQT